MRLRGAPPVELDEPVDRAFEVVGVEPVERLGRDGREREHLLREPRRGS